MKPISDYLTSLQNTIDYFKKIGINLNKSRVSEYLSTLTQHINALKGIGDFPEPGKLYSSIAETLDLASISLLPYDLLHIHKEKLIKIPFGVACYSDAAKHDPGRNTAFEFVVASRFHTAGMQVSMECPSDVVSQKDSQRILIECKRAKTALAVPKRIKEGFKQMSEHRRKGEQGYGVIAIEISEAFNPNLKVLQASTMPRAQEGIYEEIDLFFKQNHQSFRRVAQDLRSDAKIDMIFFRVQCILGTNNFQKTTCGTSWYVLPLIDHESSRFKKLDMLIRNINGFEPGMFEVINGKINLIN